MNTITVDNKEINLESRSVETLYLVTLEEYLEATGLSIESLVHSISMEIKILKSARQKYIKVYRSLPYLDPRTELLSTLLTDIDRQLVSKTKKLEKYKEFE